MNQRIQPLLEEGFSFGQLFDRRKKDPEEAGKVQFRPFIKKGEPWVQLTWVYSKKVLHENLPLAETGARLATLLKETYSQGLIRGARHDYHLTALGRLKIRTAPPSVPMGPETATHNRQKTGLLQEGEPVPFLVRLGVMTPEGAVRRDRMDKFRQLNRYLELIQGSLDRLPKNRPVRIVDFGCGKAYLTFALYHALVNCRGISAEITGLDLKEDVIDFCRQVALDLGDTGLTFEKGEIRTFQEQRPVDLVVTLHACDTATDDAIVKALQWQAGELLLVPCCQHELNGKLNSASLYPILKHGILRERMAALATDALRGQLLEACGYRVRIMEFIDLAHTPKNLMIQAVRGGGGKHAWQEYCRFRDSLGLSLPYLERRLRETGLLTVPDAPIWQSSGEKR